MSQPLRAYKGACHCGAVQFEVDAPASVTLLDCNCTVCAIVGFIHLIVPLDRFRLLAGEKALTTYTFGTGVAQHTFCKRCGVKPFYVPRSHPQGKSVNVRCMDQSEFEEVTIEAFDGLHWEQNIGGVRSRFAS